MNGHDREANRLSSENTARLLDGAVRQLSKLAPENKRDHEMWMGGFRQALDHNPLTAQLAAERSKYAALDRDLK